MIDSHCHPQFSQLVNRIEAVVANMQAAKVEAGVVVCTEVTELDTLLELADKYPFYPTLGVHPNSPEQASCDYDKLCQQFAKHQQLVAVGETGLDYFQSHDEATLAIQRERFAIQIEVALSCDKPLIVHTRESIDDTLDVLEPATKRGLRAVLHCFTGTMQQARRAWDAGLFVSYTGIVTFKNAPDLLAIAAAAPFELSMIETDSPYLAPVPYRGKTNEPAFVAHICNAIALARGLDGDEYAKITSQTTKDFYQLY